jgi:hypothetical protein
MKFTDNYRLSSIEVGEPLSPLEDSRRFLTIDRQLLGLFEVFGNGVIEGWNVVPGTELSVGITIGRGHINFLAARTLVPKAVTELVPSTVNYIYGQAVETTRFNRDVRFFTDISRYENEDEIILLAAVTTSLSGVTSIDATVRHDISFIETIRDLINQHRHRGGNDNPSKIDLQTEVTGQLPGFRVDDFDASKVISGRLDPSRLPPIDHGSLLNNGVLTHAQLDSFVRNLSNPNVGLLGEVTSSNLLHAYLALKHIWNEVDAYSFNLLALIPGISPDSFSDLSATTAIFDRTNHTIQGIPAISGHLLTTTLRTATDFRAAQSRVNIDVKSQDGVDWFQITRPFTETIVESFDNVFATAVDIPDWTVETISSDNSTTFKSDSAKKADGAFSAKLSIDQGFRLQATRFFDEDQNWSSYNELEISIDTLSPAHGQIRMEVLKGRDTKEETIVDLLVLDTNEITSGFQRVLFDVSNIVRTEVSGLRIYTDSKLGWDLSAIVVNVDRIRLNNNLYFSQSGAIRFRLETPQKSKWAAISWDADLNGGTIQTRARTASNFSIMDEATAVPFSSFFSDSGGSPNVTDNTNIEIEVAITSNSGRTLTPVVRYVTLSYVTTSESRGLTIDTTDEFLRAESQSNTRVETITPSLTDGRVVIDGRVDVGDVVYGTLRSLQQIDRFGTPIMGLTGSNLPLSPIQAAREEFVLRTPSLDGVTGVIRLYDRSYLLSDTLNDRILLLSPQGEILGGLASNNARTLANNGLYPLTATYHREAKTLYLTWTSNVNFASLDLSKVIINGSGLSIRLSNTTDTAAKLQGQNSSLDSGNVTPIVLSESHSTEMEYFLDNQSTNDPRLFVNVDPDAVSSGLDLANTNFASLSGARGLPLYVAPIRYVRGIFRPISISVTSAGNWLIGNAKPLLLNEESADVVSGVGKEEITSVLEINPATGEVVFSDDSVDFTLVTFGSAVEYNERYVLVAGINEDATAPTGSTTKTIQTASLGLGSTVTSSTTTLPDQTDTTGAVTSVSVTSEFDMISGYRGRVKIVEKRSGRVVFDESTSDGTYASDAQLDANENIVIVEKSFVGNVGKGRVVKIDELGNVFFQFGLREFASPNDVRVLSSGNLVISS